MGCATLLDRRLMDLVLACLTGSTLTLLALTLMGHYDSHPRLLLLTVILASATATRIVCTAAHDSDAEPSASV